METRSLVTRSAIVFEIVIFPSDAELGVPVLHHHRDELAACRPRAASGTRGRRATCSKTMSMTCCSTSSTGPHGDERLRDLGEDLEDAVRLLDVLDVGGAPSCSASPAASRWPVSERSLLSSPTLRMIVPASSERGLASSSTTLPSSVLLKASWNLPRGSGRRP